MSIDSSLPPSLFYIYIYISWTNRKTERPTIVFSKGERNERKMNRVSKNFKRRIDETEKYNADLEKLVGEWSMD